MQRIYWKRSFSTLRLTILKKNILAIAMETSTSEESSKVDENAGECIDEARVRKLKLIESPTCVICVER